MRSALQSLVGTLAIVVALSITAGCAPNHRTSDAGSPAPAHLGSGIRPSAAQAFLAAHPEALLLDVRNPDEWDDDLGHIANARLIPLPELQPRMGEIAQWKDKPVITVCRVGARSAAAATLLRGAGFAEVANLEGGMAAWRRAGL